MASITPGYEYDIFISYRHNDNRSGWVTEFVRALQEELASTIKEPVSVYFDTNPHDGLLETHNVDESLKAKLKCLIFIPIISQTYCDTNSFAWQHEFVTFNKLANEDQFGRDIKLVNGNVASRILPIKIHDIDKEDTALLETELGAVLRAIDFFHKSAGVNRPLTARDDEVRTSGNILYLDQVNKVANAIQDILRGIKNKDISTTSADSPVSQSGELPFRKKLAGRNVLRASLVYILIALIAWKIAVISAGLLHLTEGTIQLITLVLIVLFPLAILMAWVYERSPKGFIRTGSVASLENPFTDEQKKPFTSITFIALLLVTTAALFLLFPQMGTIESMNGINDVEKSIAVLPFVNDSPDEENTYFINGIMEEVLNNLQKIKDFRILSRTSTDQYRGASRPTIPEIAKKLGVNYIVEGSGQKYGTMFRVRVQLIEANRERHIWAESYEQEIKEPEDIFRVQSQIAQEIAAVLKVIITPEAKQIIEKAPTTSLTAYNYYLKGKDQLFKFGTGSLDRDAVKEAEFLFRKALKNDSTFAQGYVGLGYVYWKKSYYEENSSKQLDSMLLFANIALSYDDKLAEAYVIRAGYYAEIGGNLNKVIEELDKAIRFNPNLWEAYHEKGKFYSWDGDLVREVENRLKAASLNHGAQLPELLNDIGESFVSAGLPEKATYYYHEAYKLEDDSVSYLFQLAYVEWAIGNYKKSLEFLEKINTIDSASRELDRKLAIGYMYAGQFGKSMKYVTKWVDRLKSNGEEESTFSQRIGFIYWKNGYRKEADYYFDKQIEHCNYLNKSDAIWSKSHYPNYDLAGIYAFRGEKGKAYENLRIFNKTKRFPIWILMLIKNDPLFDSIRNEPEFQQIVRDVESKYRAEHERVRKWLEAKQEL